MNALDLQTMHFVNQFAQASWFFDSLVDFLSGSHLAKGGVLSVILWWTWFKPDGERTATREHVIITLFCSFVAMFVARVLALTLPFRHRPLHEPDVGFVLPHGVSPRALEGWSAFPSDHAVLFFALATGLIFAARRPGGLALGYTVVCIAMPRIYLGLHYPTDIFAGAAIGVSIALVGNLYLAQSSFVATVARWAHTRPQFFYPVFFFVTAEISDMFEGTRSVLKFVSHVIDHYAS